MKKTLLLLCLLISAPIYALRSRKCLEEKQINIIQQIATSIKVKIKKPILEKQIIDLEQNYIEPNIKPITLNLKNYNQKEFI